MKSKIFRYIIAALFLVIATAAFTYWYVAIRAEKETLKNLVSVSFHGDSVDISLNESARYICDCQIEYKSGTEINLEVFATSVMNPFAKPITSFYLPLNKGVQKIYYCDTSIVRR